MRLRLDEVPGSTPRGGGFPRRVGEGAAAVLLLGFSVAASLGAAELLVRWTAPQQLILVRPDIWQPAEMVGWSHRGGVDTRVNTGERNVRWVTDDRGFRVSSEGAVAAERSVLLLGDSFMAALQVEHEQSLAGLMEMDLRESLEVDMGVDNTGVGGWDPPHYLMTARRLLPDEEYALTVVAVYLGNDIVPRRVEAYPERRPVEWARFRVPRAATVEEWVEGVARPLNDYLKQRSHLFILAKNGFEVLLMRLGLTERYVPWGIQPENADDPAWEVTAELLRDIAVLGDGQGTPTLFVLIPSYYQVDLQALARHAHSLGFDPDLLVPDQPSHVLGKGLRERGLRVVDPLPVFRLAHESGVPLYGRVDPHLSPQGHRVLWDAIRHEVAHTLGQPPPPGWLAAPGEDDPRREGQQIVDGGRAEPAGTR